MVLSIYVLVFLLFFKLLKVVFYSFCRILVQVCLALLPQIAADQNLLEVGNEITVLLQLLQEVHQDHLSPVRLDLSQNSMLQDVLHCEVIVANGGIYRYVASYRWEEFFKGFSVTI